VKRLFIDISNLAAKKLTPLKKGDPKARIPVSIDGKRVFPPTIDHHGVITYHYEWDEQWKPYSHNYFGHGWLVVTQLGLWFGVWYTDALRYERTEKDPSS